MTTEKEPMVLVLDVHCAECGADFPEKASAFYGKPMQRPYPVPVQHLRRWALKAMCECGGQMIVATEPVR